MNWIRMEEGVAIEIEIEGCERLCSSCTANARGVTIGGGARGLVSRGSLM
jgi:hypothetical protein